MNNPSFYVDTLQNKDAFSPATKEQRDLLFTKMKEAGYEWDNEKKELKKFHVIDEGKSEMDYCFTKMMNGEKVSSAWSKEDNKWIESLIQTFEDGYFEGFNQLKSYGVIDWLKSLRPHPQWKPSKEQITILSYMRDDFDIHTNHSDKQLFIHHLDELIEQLKKLK